jgi:hypothetical protein
VGEVTRASLEPEGVQAEIGRLRELSDEAEAGDKEARRELRRLVKRASPAAIAEASSVARRSEAMLIKTVAGDEPLMQEALRVRLRDMRSEIAGDNPTALGAMLADRVVAGWLLVEVLEALIAAQYARNLPAHAKLSSPAYLMQQSKILESATRRLMQTIQTLARVRKLLGDTPGVQVNTQINVLRD